MRPRKFWALIALNVLLLAVLAWKMGGEPRAMAQAARPGEYLMVPGRITGANTGIVFVVDTRNGILTALTFDENDRQRPLQAMPPIDLGRIFAAGGVRPK